MAELNKYIFPFTTCEPKSTNAYIAQPYSFSINVLACLVLLYFLLQDYPLSTKLIILAILIFEIWHAISHAIHLPNINYMRIIHYLFYLIIASFVYYIYDHKPDKFFNLPIITYLVIVFAIFIDTYLLFWIKGGYSVISGILLFAIVLISFWSLLPINLKNHCFTLLGLILLGIVLFINEYYNCEKMLSLLPLPYHALVEIVVFTSFMVLIINL